LILGIILVHDLTNRKSQENLYKWLAEAFNRDNASKPKKNDEFDAEQFVGYSQVLFDSLFVFYNLRCRRNARRLFSSLQIPVLVIGTKADMVGDSRIRAVRRSSYICDEYGADEIFLVRKVNCANERTSDDCYKFFEFCAFSGLPTSQNTSRRYEFSRKM
jgi:Rab-like protein 3